jgi:hypothetical protein
VVVALVVTPEGLPLAYAMFPGNTADKTTLRGMIETIQRRFGKAERIWIMDRGIPTEEVLAEFQKQAPSRDGLLKKLGAAQERAGRVATGLVQVEVSAAGLWRYELDRAALRAVRQREGRHLLRTNMTAEDPSLIWHCYMQLCHGEEAFGTLKGDLGLRPIFHQKPERIEAHLFVAFLACCLMTTLRQQLRFLQQSALS